LYQTIGIVYDPELSKAFWVDISQHLKSHPQVHAKNHHIIRVMTDKEFSQESFPLFIDYCFQYIEDYKSFENYGRSLDWFAQTNNPELCYEALKSLYSHHGDKPSAWSYIISNFGKIQQEGIRRNIIGLISNYADNPHIFWHAGNMQYYPRPEMQDYISKQVSESFREKEIRILLPYLRQGIYVGDFSYNVFRVLDMIEDTHLVLKKIAFEPDLDPEDRNHCFCLYLHFAKYHSIEATLSTAKEYLKAFPYGYDDEALIATMESIEAGEIMPVGHF
jgi:hypothetical protein